MKSNNSLSWIRGAILVCAGLLLVANAYSLTTWRLWIDPSLSGKLGVTLRPGLVDERPRIERLDANGALAAAGAQVGDLIVFTHPGLREIEFLPVATPIAATLYGAAGPREISIRPQPKPPGASQASIPYALISILNRIMAIGLAVIIVLRKGKDGAMLAFAASLLANAPVQFLSHMPIGSLQDWATFIVRPLDFFSGYWFFLLFALMYPAQNALWQRRGVAAAMLAFGATFLANSCFVSWSRFGLVHLPTTLAWAPAANSWFAVLTALVTLAVLSRAWLTQTGAIRDRLGWILLSIGVTYVMWMVVNFMNAIGVPQPSATPIVVSLINFFGYIGFGYALLRHRIFDFGFAVNRALVFTCISTLLLLLFGVTEFAVDKLLHFEGRQKNVVFDAAVALGIILCFHRIQHWVSHRIDHTFFHHWYAAAEALRIFVKRSPHIVSMSALQENYLAEMKKFCGAHDVAQYLRGADLAYHRTHGDPGQPMVIPADSRLAVALRHGRAVVDLGTEEFEVGANFAFPMLLRGAVTGILLFLPKEDGTSYRPDEIKLLAECVRSYALDLESLRVEELEQKMTVMAESKARLESLVEVLRPSVGTATVT